MDFLVGQKTGEKFNKLKKLRLCTFVGLSFFCGLSSVLGQASTSRAGGEQRKIAGMERIDREEGERRLEAFRRQRLQGDFVFQFQLAHKPARDRTVRYEGTMWGTWNDQGPLSRFALSFPAESLVTDLNGDGKTSIELITQNGAEPLAWIRREGQVKFSQLTGEAMTQPLIPGIVYTPFDLLMPFIYWEEFEYEGPSLKGVSRVAQQFRMLPPEDSEALQRGISAVRVGLDDTYDALLRVEVFKAGKPVSRFSVDSFKKVQDQYIVRQITLLDHESGDATSFRVMGARVGITLDSFIFDAEVGQSNPRENPDDFEWFAGRRS